MNDLDRILEAVAPGSFWKVKQFTKQSIFYLNFLTHNFLFYQKWHPQ